MCRRADDSLQAVDIGGKRPVVQELVPYRWELLALLWFAFLFNQADRAMFGFVMPLIKDDLALTDVQLGIVASTFHLFYGVLAPVAGYAGDVFRRSRVVVASIATWSLATLLTGFSTRMAHLVLLPFRRDYVAPGVKGGPQAGASGCGGSPIPRVLDTPPSGDNTHLSCNRGADPPGKREQTAHSAHHLQPIEGRH